MKTHSSDRGPAHAPGHRNTHRRLALLCLALLGLFALSLLIGRYPKAGFISLATLRSEPLAMRIILQLRLPRILTAILGGAVLGASGFIFQMLFSNPIVEPGFLGVSQGAAFGAALSILIAGYAPFLIQVSAAIFAVIGLALSFTLARRFHYGGWILRLVLSGIAVSALFSSGLGFIKYAADPMSELQEITFWLLGGLWNITWEQFMVIFPITVSSLAILLLFRWRINVLSLEERTAHSLGISPAAEKRLILFIATIGTASVISVSGLIGWIGLIVPHLSRRLFGANATMALPGTMVIGSLYLLACDTLGRSLLAGELPLGIVTSITGTVLFILLLSSRRGLGESV